MSGSRRMRLIGVLRVDGANARAIEAELGVDADGSWRIRWSDVDGSERVLADGNEQTVGWLLRRIVGEFAAPADGSAAPLHPLLLAEELRRLTG